MRTLVKRALRLSPAWYGEAKWIEMRTRYALGRPHEDAFHVFAALPKTGLFADIGANAGQSALSFAALRPHWSIVSFEPNPALGAYLDRVSRLLRGRHTWRNMGLGAAAGRLPFHIPARRGVEATQEGSFRREALTDAAARRRAGAPDEIHTIDVPVERLDRLGLLPDAIKLDVQGFEYEALLGMEDLFRRRPPLMLYVEYGPDSARVARWLGEFGYLPSYWNGNALVDWSGCDCDNLIFRR